MIRRWFAPSRAASRARCWCSVVAVFAALAGCAKKEAPPAPGPVQVSVMTVEPRDTPVQFEFVAQTQSSREVEIRARVDGFLDKRLYTEGDMVKAGQPMFQMDRKPFEAALQSAQGQLAEQKARLEVASANLARVRPLAARNAVSKKELDDAIGFEKQSAAAVLAAQGDVRQANLNLGYTTINSPLKGLSSFAKKQEGSYLTAGQEGLLTTVSQVDPIWVNFSVSENELLSYRDQRAAGKLQFPANQDFEVEVVLADGSVYPYRGRINFTAPSFSTETGTFLVRTELPNPSGLLRPGQFVRALVIGATRPGAILVPQRSVQQGAKGHYVWVIGNDGKPQQRVVEVGEWHGDDWFITDGLKNGERVVVDGAGRVAPGAPLQIAAAPKQAQAQVQAGGAGGAPPR
ncbi:efflux RND transporter periplasmic adaptor subunit [Massilia horti]|uniref:Efflux RND transporter periplasmic adaptor subunit n=1 Tax=Massilia horti TaxID=2562153 RepID=A0A4Y9SKF9_9BURK|nr:efflux RND transporter periplasmic adaptor subunit [Massilia horti]TFW27165.1 efflux RND transporter periplasmic adaptor subunit [Massilia horti]